MSLDAGSVFTILGGRFNPAGFAEFDAANKRVVAGAAAAESANKRASGAMAAMGTVAKTGAAIGVAAVAVALVKSAGAAANFETQMSEVQAITKANASDFKKLRDAALDLGAKTGVGATKAAKALAELAKGGLSTKQTIGALRGTIAMSQAGSMDLADAATTVAQALNLFKLEGKDASHVADAFATAANKTTADVSFFAQGLAQGGLAARTAGLSFDETTAALEAMAASGFKSGSDAGTSLKTALIQLAAPSKRAQEEIKSLGISLFDAHGAIKPLPQIAQTLGKAWGDMSNKERIASASRLVGTDGMRALLALYEQGPAKLKRFEQGLAEQGTAQDVANKKMDNLQGSWQKFTAQLQTMAIKVGTAMLPTLKTATDGVTRFFDSLNKGNLRGTGFGRLLDDVRGVVSPILGVFSTLARGAAMALGAIGKVPGFGMFKTLASEANGAADGIDALKGALDGIGKKKSKVEITAKVKDEASHVLNDLSAKQIRSKIVHILGNKDDVDSKVRALKALGISGPTANFIASTGSVSAARAAILAQGPVLVPVLFKKLGKTPSRAAGKGAGHGEDALVGEGGGPEIVGNQKDGWHRVSAPTLLSLGADDYVIPTEQRYRGRALGLLASAFGIQGYAKGKPGKKKHAPRPIPKNVYLGHSVEFFDGEVQHLTTVSQDRDKKNKLTARARKARKELAEMKRVQRQAHAYDDRVKKHEDEANIQNDNMRAADSRDDVGGYKAAWKNRLKELKAARSLLRGALAFAPASSKYHQDIRARIATINTYLDDMTGDKAGSPLEAKDQAETTFTDTEQGRLDALDAAIAVASLTDTKSDDLSAEQAKEAFLAPLLASVQASGGSGRGGASAITEIANELKTTRDAITDLQKPPDITADQQASADQAYQRGIAAASGASIDRLVAATLNGAGAPQLVFQSYVPPSPSEARRLADHVVSGIDFQGGRPASTQRIGV